MDVFELIRTAAGRNATDVQMVASSPPLLRIHGALMAMGDQAPLTAKDITDAFNLLTNVKEKESYERDWELDFGYTLAGVGRLRCNAARQSKGLTLSVRLLPLKVPTIDELGLPEIYKELVHEPRGLILISGPSDSGKSTTLAAMVQQLNIYGGHHIVTIEDPIEYQYEAFKSAITQRQLGRDTHSFGQALKHLLRQNPDVVVVGEMRDYETAAGVIAAAETGHLVMSTSHAPSAPQAIERIVDMFPAMERQMAQAHLASLLVAVVCQKLAPRASGSGRTAAVEIMLTSPAVRNLIRDGKIHQLESAIRSQHDIGMRSLDDSLVELYQKNIITYETASAFCQNPEEVAKVAGIMPNGKRASVRH